MSGGPGAHLACAVWADEQSTSCCSSSCRGFCSSCRNHSCWRHLAPGNKSLCSCAGCETDMTAIKRSVWWWKACLGQSFQLNVCDHFMAGRGEGRTYYWCSSWCTTWACWVWGGIRESEILERGGVLNCGGVWWWKRLGKRLSVNLAVQYAIKCEKCFCFVILPALCILIKSARDWTRTALDLMIILG